jgi:hypothetical protein
MGLTLRLSKRFPLTYKELDDNFTFLSSSFLSGLGSAVIQNNILSNQKVGGVVPGDYYPAQTPIETIITDMLVGNITATLGSLTVSGPGFTLSSNVTREIGNSFTVNTATFTATPNSPAGNYPFYAGFTASNASTGNFTYYFGDNALSANNSLSLGGSRTINRTSPSLVTLAVKATDAVGDFPLQTTRTVNYVYPIYYGMSAIDYSTSGNPSASLSTLIEAKGTKALSINGNLQYVYFAYPTVYDNLTSIKDGNQFEVLTAFRKFTRNIDGATWTNQSYNIYIATWDARTSTLNRTTVNPAQTYTFTF